MSKYGDDIRRIARYKDTKDAAIDGATKAAIDAARGVAYFDAAGVIKSSKSVVQQNPIVTTGEKAVTQGATDALKKAIEQSADAKNNKFDTTQDDEKTVDAKDLIDGTVPNTSLKEVTGMTDPAYGQTTKVRLTNDYRGVAATSYGLGQPNSTGEFDNPDVPPLAQDYIAGFWFNFSHSGGILGNYVTNRYSEGLEWDLSNTSAFNGAIFHSWRDGPPNGADLPGAGSNASVTYRAAVLKPTDPPDTPSATIAFQMFRCDMNTPPFDLSPYCSVIPPYETKWPTSAITQLSLQIDGLFKSSPFDQSDTGKAMRDGVAVLWMKFDNGTRNLIFEPGRNNTTLIYEVNSSGDAISNVFVYPRGEEATVELPSGQTIVSAKPRKLLDIVNSSDVYKWRIGNPTIPVRLTPIYIK